MIEQGTLSEACERIVAAIAANRLVILCGAGLSMASPSNLPSAAAIADKARETHARLSGGLIPQDLGGQADYFFDRKQLENYFIRALIDRNAFAGLPNAGHLAIADLILTQAAEAVISTNVDGLIEAAGYHLFGEIEVALDGLQAAAAPHTVLPLLKIHGCWSRDRARTIWTAKQLDTDTIGARITHSAQWLQQILRDKDLLIVGFWSDWAYLNNILGEALGATLPSQITIFDMSSMEILKAKAPDICALSERNQVDFRHVQVSGADALTAVRISFSKAIIRGALRMGRDEYEAQQGAAPDEEWLKPPETDAESLWLMRRDIHGCRPNTALTTSLGEIPGPAVGYTLLRLRAAGATLDGRYWRLGEVNILILATPGEFMHNVKAAYQGETPPVGAADMVICVGAEESGLRSDVVRGERDASFVGAGPPGRWLTRASAFEALGL